ncbi:cholesterol oxidase substrate-binding domain-containing protein [Streptomyces zaehneri]|uniref:cholesterol oxidase substrate-binding domain-containing protein n=1 Tax=Streptomyces zaehneri TaxID=3051180 RepID=UPI0028D537E5|nr:cholesterol oxidase substrate-binding domain-containing protein [Streptomyces sp. DSM 40713]
MTLFDTAAVCRLSTYDGTHARTRVEWSKGWAYTDEAAWSDGEVHWTTVPAPSAPRGTSFGTASDEAAAVPERLDPHRVFRAPLHGRLFPQGDRKTGDGQRPRRHSSGLNQTEKRGEWQFTVSVNCHSPHCPSGPPRPPPGYFREVSALACAPRASFGPSQRLSRRRAPS